MEHTTEIVSCNGTVIYQTTGKQLDFYTSGTLQILLLYDGMLSLRVNHFEYLVNPDQTISY